jgi:hypothetical protein
MLSFVHDQIDALLSYGPVVAQVATLMQAVFRAALLRCHPAIAKIRTPEKVQEKVQLYGELLASIQGDPSIVH